MMKRMTSGGGFAALRYTLRMARRVGFWRLWQAMRSKNGRKTLHGNHFWRMSLLRRVMRRR